MSVSKIAKSVVAMCEKQEELFERCQRLGARVSGFGCFVQNPIQRMLDDKFITIHDVINGQKEMTDLFGEAAADLEQLRQDIHVFTQEFIDKNQERGREK